jgi:hypothetical protein
LYGEYEGKQYCVLHFPSKTKTADTHFKEALHKKKANKDFDFSGVYFPSISKEFESFEFETPVSFYGTTFSEGANFVSATFSEEADFSEATFSEVAHFGVATFCEEAHFGGATFCEGADFGRATFCEEADFGGATFCERADFGGLKTFPETFLSLAGASMERPGLISFHTTHLRPGWFVDLDAQKIDFTDVEWFRLSNGEELTLEAEEEALRNNLGIESSASLRKLQRACRRLMNNAEENRDYPSANEFHYWSMEAQRKEGWRRLGFIGTAYWALSGYGERPLRALLVLVGMWISFAVLYMVVGHPQLRAFPASGVGRFVVDAWQALAYSLAAIARLNPRPLPVGPGLFQFLVTAAGILGPLQIALFALAVRRRVMR